MNPLILLVYTVVFGLFLYTFAVAIPDITYTQSEKPVFLSRLSDENDDMIKQEITKTAAGGYVLQDLEFVVISSTEQREEYLPYIPQEKTYLDFSLFLSEYNGTGDVIADLYEVGGLVFNITTEEDLELALQVKNYFEKKAIFRVTTDLLEDIMTEPRLDEMDIVAVLPSEYAKLASGDTSVSNLVKTLGELDFSSISKDIINGTIYLHSQKTEGSPRITVDNILGYYTRYNAALYAYLSRYVDIIPWKFTQYPFVVGNEEKPSKALEFDKTATFKLKSSTNSLTKDITIFFDTPFFLDEWANLTLWSTITSFFGF